MNGPATGASAYKIWVTTLKAWSRDPSTSLDALPALSAESFSAATSRRFNDHLMTAVRTMMSSWVDSFQRDLQAVTSTPSSSPSWGPGVGSFPGSGCASTRGCPRRPDPGS